MFNKYWFARTYKDKPKQNKVQCAYVKLPNRLFQGTELKIGVFFITFAKI